MFLGTHSRRFPDAVKLSWGPDLLRILEQDARAWDVHHELALPLCYSPGRHEKKAMCWQKPRGCGSQCGIGVTTRCCAGCCLQLRSRPGHCWNVTLPRRLSTVEAQEFSVGSTAAPADPVLRRLYAKEPDPGEAVPLTAPWLHTGPLQPIPPIGARAHAGSN